MSLPLYLSLRIKAPERLASLRRAADTFNQKHPLDTPRTWRNFRFSTFLSEQGLSSGLQDKEPVWYTHDGPHFRKETWADEVVNLNHTGWFTDQHQDGKLRGFVAHLPHGRIIAGYWDSNSGKRVYFPTVHDEAEDAARAADEEARVAAEEEYAYQDRWEAAKDLHTEIGLAQLRIRELIALRNIPRFRFSARASLSVKIEAVREMQERLKTEYNDIEI